jgi:transcription antitermination factor NusG
MSDLETSELRSNVIKKLTESGITPTRQRVDIGQCLFVKDQHITAEQLREQVNEAFAEVSKATVYNTLGLFAAEGLLREVIVDPSKHVYDTVEPLFPRYLFIHLALFQDSFYSIRSTRGVSKIVQFGNEPVKVPAGLVDKLKASQSPGQEFIDPALRFLLRFH